MNFNAKYDNRWAMIEPDQLNDGAYDDLLSFMQQVELALKKNLEPIGPARENGKSFKVVLDHYAADKIKLSVYYGHQNTGHQFVSLIDRFNNDAPDQLAFHLTACQINGRDVLLAQQSHHHGSMALPLDFAPTYQALEKFVKSVRAPSQAESVNSIFNGLNKTAAPCLSTAPTISEIVGKVFRPQIFFMRDFIACPSPKAAH